MSKKRLIDANDLVQRIYNAGLWDDSMAAAIHWIDSAPTVPAVVLPCDYGAKLYKVTKPYRQEPQVTEFIVVNFRTAGKKHVLQVEVRVNGMPGTNWMPYSKFHASKEEAEAALSARSEKPREI